MKRYTLAVLAFCAVLGSCATTPSQPGLATFPGQDEAVRLVWREVYGRLDTAPRIEWVYVEPAASCVQRGDGMRGFIAYGECVGGVTYSPTYVSSIHPIEGKYSRTSMAHEFRHALLLRTGVPLPHHSGGSVRVPERDTAFYVPVELANGALAAEGR
jgi:hypothetical protein